MIKEKKDDDGRKKNFTTMQSNNALIKLKWIVLLESVWERSKQIIKTVSKARCLVCWVNIEHTPRWSFKSLPFIHLLCVWKIEQFDRFDTFFSRVFQCDYYNFWLDRWRDDEVTIATTMFNQNFQWVFTTDKISFLTSLSLRSRCARATMPCLDRIA